MKQKCKTSAAELNNIFFYKSLKGTTLRKKSTTAFKDHRGKGKNIGTPSLRCCCLHLLWCIMCCHFNQLSVGFLLSIESVMLCFIYLIAITTKMSKYASTVVFTASQHNKQTVKTEIFQGICRNPGGKFNTF